MANLQSLFTQLNEAAPEICHKVKDGFAIGNYVFFEADIPDSSAKELAAFIKGDYHPVTGQPALDWLCGALQQVVYNKGWALDTCQLATPHNGYNAIIGNEYDSDWQPTMAQALLTALIAALQEAK